LCVDKDVIAMLGFSGAHPISEMRAMATPGIERHFNVLRG
jgi:hypothetical protein